MTEINHADIEPYLRLSVFLGVLLVMMLAEWLFPRRDTQSRLKRWPSNIGLVVLNTLIVRVILPGVTVALAIYLTDKQFGLMYWLNIPSAVALVVCVLLLDMMIYWQHRWFHHVPMLWHIHRMHHADKVIDVTTGARFHPIEIVASTLLKLIAITVLGASAWAVIIFEILLNGTAMFNHSNVNLPQWLDRILRPVLVTPDMHRVHHSIHASEHHQNFGFNLSVWDRWFKSYTAQPKDGHLEMQIGLPYFREDEQALLHNMLKQPFDDTGK